MGNRPFPSAVLASRREALPAGRLSPPAPSGLRRGRLLAALDRARARLVLVSAPAGAGKTTLLAQYAASARADAGHRLAWYRAEASDRAPGVLSRNLAAALSAAGLGSGRPEPLLRPEPDPDGDTVLALLDRAAGRVTVVVDDAHLAAGPPAEEALARIVGLAPARAHFVVAGRHDPGPGMSPLRLGVDTVLLGVDDLRFRSWEVEELFDRHYREPLPPEDVAALARHTEGWAAGLQMFHLATTGKPLPQRRDAVAGLWGRGRLLRSYLAATVLSGLSPTVRDFLVRTSALRVLDGSSCDRLIGRTDSAELLAWLAERQLFTVRVDEVTGVYRYHAALQVQLESLLLDRLGADGARAWYRRAAAVSEEAGRPHEALRGYLHADDWRGARDVLARHGARIAQGSVPDEAVVAGLADDDPWLALAAARRRVAVGDLAGAAAAYRTIDDVPGAGAVQGLARQERLAAEAWLPGRQTWRAVAPTTPARDSWPAPAPPWALQLREALRQGPGRFGPGDGPGEAARPSDAGWPDTTRPGRGRRASGAGTTLTAAIAALLDGDVRGSVRLAHRVEAWPDSPMSLAARLLAATVDAALETGGAAVVEQLAAEAEWLGQPWLARVARALTAVDGTDLTSARAVRATCVRDGDAWGALLAELAEGVGGLVAGGAPWEPLEYAVDRAHRLDAGAVEAWARGLLALAMARAGLVEASLEASRAETCARSAGVPAARALAFAALARVDGGADGEYEELARATVAEHALPVPRPRSEPARPPGAGSAATPRVAVTRPPLRTRPAAGVPVHLTVLGGFRLLLAGADVDWTLVRPRARAMLRMLAAYADQPVHEERIGEALWPALPPASARHNLHVAMSSLRRALEPEAPRGASTLLQRVGPTYRLALPPGGQADVVRLRSALSRWQQVRGLPAAQVRPDLRAVLDAYAGDLLPEDGPAEWVVAEREALRNDAARAAVALAELELTAGDGAAAAEAAERAVRIDPYRDDGWRLLAAACDLRGDAAAASRARAGYTEVLRQLGVAGPAATA